MSSAKGAPQKKSSEKKSNAKGTKALAKRKSSKRDRDRPKAKPEQSKDSQEEKEEKKDTRHPAEILSENNENKLDRLVLSSKVSNSEFMTLSGMTKVPLVNGKTSNPHAFEAGSRLVRIWAVLDDARKRDRSIVDIQGKPRGGRWLESADGSSESVAYPHCHCFPLTAADLRRFRDPCDWECGIHFDTAMSVDVLTHLTQQEVLRTILLTDDNEMFFVYNDLYRNKIPKGYKLVMSNGHPVYLRGIKGHSDNNNDESDLFQPWLLDGSFVAETDGETYVVSFEHWGPSDGSLGTILLARAQVATPESIAMVTKATTPLLIDTDFWTFAQAGDVPVGRYRFAKVKNADRPEQSYCVVTATHVIFGEGEVKIMHRATMEATLASQRMGSVTSASSRTAVRELTTTLPGAEKTTMKETLESNVAVDWNSQQAKSRLSAMDKWFPPKDLDSIAVLAAKLDPVVNTDPVPQTSVNTWLPSVKHVSGLFHALPKFVSAAPIAALMITYVAHMLRKKVIPQVDNRTWIRKLWDRFGHRLRWDQAMHMATGKVTPDITSGSVKTMVLRIFAGQLFGLGSWHEVSWDNRFWYIGVPVIEELYKSVFGYLLSYLSLTIGEKQWNIPISPRTGVRVASVSFATGEFISYLLKNPITKQLVFSRLAAWGMHVAIGGQTYVPRVALHGLWNLYALYSIPAKVAHTVDYGDGVMGPITGTLAPYKCLRKDENIVLGSQLWFTYAGRKHKYPFTDAAWQILEKIDGKRRDLVPNTIVYWPYFPGIQAKDPMSFAVGMLTRVMKDRCLDPDAESWEKSVNLLQQTVVPDSDWVTFDEWNSRYPAPVAARNLLAMKNILSGHQGKYFVAPFNKDELNHTFVSLGVAPKDPRIICGPGEQEVKVLSGPFYYSINKTINASWDGKALTTLMLDHWRTDVCILAFSGNDLDHPGESQMQRFARFVQDAQRLGPSGRKVSIAVAGDDNFIVLVYTVQTPTGPKPITIMFCSDGRRWDSSITDPALSAEERFVVCLAKRKCFDTLIFGQDTFCTLSDICRLYSEAKEGLFTCKHFADQGVSFGGAMPPIRHSGGQNTTGGNNVLNASGSLRAAGNVFAWLDDNITEVPPDASYLLDCKKVVVDTWLTLGVEVDVIISNDVTDGDFCSSLLIPCQGQLYAVPKIGRFLARSGFSIGVPRSLEELRAQLTQFEPFLNVPILGDHLRAVRAKIGYGEEKINEEFIYNPHFGQKSSFPVPDETTWKWFRNRYGITELQVNMMKVMLTMVDRLPFQLDGNIVAPIFRVDLDLPLFDPLNIDGSALGCWQNLFLPSENIQVLMKPTKKEIKKEVKKDIKKDIKKVLHDGTKVSTASVSRSALGHLTGERKGRNQADHVHKLDSMLSKSPVHSPGCATPGDSAALEYVAAITDQTLPQPLLPQIVGLGQSGTNGRIFEVKSSCFVTTNALGFAFISAEASGWIPITDPFLNNGPQSVTSPAFSSIGYSFIGPNDEVAGGGGRGAPIYWSNETYAGGVYDTTNTWSAQQHPPSVAAGAGVPVRTQVSPQLPAQTAVTGIECYTLPPALIINQITDGGTPDFANSVARQTYTLNRVVMSIQPSGYKTGAGSAVNVVSGRVLGWQYMAGDNRFYHFAQNYFNTTNGVTDSSITTVLGAPEGIYHTVEQSVADWPPGKQLTVYGIPNTSTAFGQWPAYAEYPSSVSPLVYSKYIQAQVKSPVCGFMIDGAQPNQKFECQFTYTLTGYGVESYEIGGRVESNNRKPVDMDEFSDMMTRTLPQVAQPVMHKTDSAPTPNHGVQSFIATQADSGHSNPVQIAKSAASATSATSEILPLIADAAMGLLALF